MMQAVVFDMDGVIIDSEPIHFLVERKLFEKLQLPISEEEHYTFTGVSCRDMWRYIKEKYTIRESVEEMVDINWETFYKSLNSHSLLPIAGLIPLLKDLKSNNIWMSVASSGSLKNIELVLNMFDIRHFFSNITSGDEVARSKPDPAIFLLTARRLQVSPASCVVIEDSKNGIKAAKLAGMKCIGFKNPNSGNQDLSEADQVVESLEELNYQVLLKL